MLGWKGVLNVSMITIARYCPPAWPSVHPASLYIAMGFFGYLKYGQDTQATITLNMDLVGQILKHAHTFYWLLENLRFYFFDKHKIETQSCSNRLARKASLGRWSTQVKHNVMICAYLWWKDKIFINLEVLQQRPSLETANGLKTIVFCCWKHHLLLFCFANESPDHGASLRDFKFQIN